MSFAHKQEPSSFEKKDAPPSKAASSSSSKVKKSKKGRSSYKPDKPKNRPSFSPYFLKSNGSEYSKSEYQTKVRKFQEKKKRRQEKMLEMSLSQSDGPKKKDLHEVRSDFSKNRVRIAGRQASKNKQKAILEHYYAKGKFNNLDKVTEQYLEFKSKSGRSITIPVATALQFVKFKKEGSEQKISTDSAITRNTSPQRTLDHEKQDAGIPISSSPPSLPDLNVPALGRSDTLPIEKPALERPGSMSAEDSFAQSRMSLDADADSDSLNPLGYDGLAFDREEEDDDENDLFNASFIPSKKKQEPGFVETDVSPVRTSSPRSSHPFFDSSSPRSLSHAALVSPRGRASSPELFGGTQSNPVAQPLTFNFSGILPDSRSLSDSDHPMSVELQQRM